MNIEELTIGDLEDVEQVTGMSFPEVAAALEGAGEALPPIKIVKALIWVTRRKDDPAFTLEDTASMKLSELASVFQSETADPTDAVNAASV